MLRDLIHTDEFFDLDDIISLSEAKPAEEEDNQLELSATDRILADQTKIHQDRMKAAAVATERVFKMGQIATILVLKLLSLRGERARPHVVITDFNQGGYQAAIQEGIILQRFGQEKLNSVPRAQEEAYMKIIPRVPTKNGMILRVFVSEALQALHKRDSVGAAQEAGREVTKTALLAPLRIPTTLPTSNEDSPIMVSDNESSSTPSREPTSSPPRPAPPRRTSRDRKSTRLNSSHWE